MEVPVTPVVEKTVPVYLDYVGTTDAIRTVTLQAQVTGYLLKRAVPDGSDVAKGELLYQIDPRNYQAALDQAKAQAEKDAAALRIRQGQPPPQRGHEQDRRCVDRHLAAIGERRASGQRRARGRSRRHRDGADQPRLYRDPRALRRPSQLEPGE